MALTYFLMCFRRVLSSEWKNPAIGFFLPLYLLILTTLPLVRWLGLVHLFVGGRLVSVGKKTAWRIPLLEAQTLSTFW
jgi:hypothetical protein